MTFKKTKIICTMGPATDDIETLKALAAAGMNVVRLNLSHDNHEMHRQRIQKIKQLREELNIPLAILLDTKGPEIRIKTFQNGRVMLKKGQRFVLTTQEVEGNEERVSITFKKLPQCIMPETTLLLNDGLIELAVESIEGPDIICKVVVGGELSNRKSVNIPNVCIDMPYISKADEADILFCIEQEVDFIALSFVRDASDVREVRNLLYRNGGEDIELIAKIENRQGVENIDSILNVSDGIMIARGDMGVEIPYEELPYLQKEIIKKCYRASKKVITATQMLESMINSPRPTRAEITDVANAVFDGTSATMLSGETAVGKNNVKAVEAMSRIIAATEKNINYVKRFNALDVNIKRISDAVSHATCAAAHDLKAAAILVVTQSGSTARMISSFRPNCPIIAATTSKKVFYKLSLSWGIIPVMAEPQPNTDMLFKHATECAKKTNLIKKGDLVVITAGVPVGISGNTNILKIDHVK